LEISSAALRSISQALGVNLPETGAGAEEM
jgi:hypothetical protein